MTKRRRGKHPSLCTAKAREKGDVDTGIKQGSVLMLARSYSLLLIGAEGWAVVL